MKAKKEVEEILEPCNSVRYSDCAANKDGECTCLADTAFEGRCPFYREKTEAQDASINALTSLIKKGRFDLIRKYKSYKRLSEKCDENLV